MTRQKDEPLRVEQVHIERTQDGRARVRIGEWVSEPMTREEAQQREAEFLKEAVAELNATAGEYEEPDPPARTIEELEAQWKANGMPDERCAEMIAEVKRLGLLDPPPHRPSAEAGARFLAESFAALDIPADITAATLQMLLGKEADKPLDVPLRERPGLEGVVKAAYQSNLYSLAEARRRRQTERQGATTTRSPLQFRELCAVEEAGPEADWLWRGYLAPGVFTILSGKPKGGKSTLTFNLLKALEASGEFLGQSVKATKTVYLSEESARSLRQKIARFELRPGHVRILTRQDAFPRRLFPEVVAAAVKEAGDVGAKLLIVDTVAFWGGLEKDEEQDSGVMTALGRVLQQAAAEGKLAVLAIHHDKKGDAVGIDQLRGSGAFAAGADLVLQFRAPKQGQPERELRGWGRYDETPAGVRLSYDGTYKLVGALDGKGPDAKRQKVLAQLPTNEPGLTADEITDRARLPVREVRGILKAAYKDQLVQRSGTGTKKDPYRFRLKPDAGAFGAFGG